jgi:hypothetical protein
MAEQIQEVPAVYLHRCCDKSVGVDENTFNYWKNHLLPKYLEVTVQKTHLTLMRLVSFSAFFPRRQFQLEKLATG